MCCSETRLGDVDSSERVPVFEKKTPKLECSTSASPLPPLIKVVDHSYSGVHLACEINAHFCKLCWVLVSTLT